MTRSIILAGAALWCAGCAADETSKSDPVPPRLDVQVGQATDGGDGFLALPASSVATLTVSGSGLPPGDWPVTVAVTPPLGLPEAVPDGGTLAGPAPSATRYVHIGPDQKLTETVFQLVPLAPGGTSTITAHFEDLSATKVVALTPPVPTVSLCNKAACEDMDAQNVCGRTGPECNPASPASEAAAAHSPSLSFPLDGPAAEHLLGDRVWSEVVMSNAPAAISWKAVLGTTGGAGRLVDAETDGTRTVDVRGQTIPVAIILTGVGSVALTAALEGAAPLVGGWVSVAPATAALDRLDDLGSGSYGLNICTTLREGSVTISNGDTELGEFALRAPGSTCKAAGYRSSVYARWSGESGALVRWTVAASLQSNDPQKPQTVVLLNRSQKMEVPSASPQP